MSAPAPQPSDRRRHDRVACQIALTGRTGNRQAPVTAVDLSPTGARVLLPADWQGQSITLSGEGLRDFPAGTPGLAKPPLPADLHLAAK